MVQTDFSPQLFRGPEADPRLGEFYSYLDARGDWTTARQVRRDMGWCDRTCRRLAEESEGQILSGQGGYKLTRLATPEECDRAVTWLRSQAKKMFRRSIRIQRVHHQRLKPTWNPAA